MKFLRTDPSHPSFQKLVRLLDEELTSLYGAEMQIFNPHNILKENAFSLLVLENEEPIGIGAFRILENPQEVEIKRMYVPPAHRGKGISKLILEELEKWAMEENCTYAKLETGVKNTAALGLYPRAGYQRIEPFGPYVVIDNSICFGKKLK